MIGVHACPAIRSYAMADYDMDSSELISVAR